MLNKVKSSILYSRVDCSIRNAGDKVKNTAKSVANSATPKNVAKAACTVAATTSAINAGAAAASIITNGATKKAVASAVVHTAKAVGFNSIRKDIKNSDNK